jgi:MFS family permease
LNSSDRGFLSVLRNRDFLYLWIAQVLSMTVQNGIHFTQMILIENLTGSTASVGGMILAFSLPAVVLSAGAAVLVDRIPKKQILVVSNFLRVLTGIGYVLLLRSTSGWVLVASLYVLTFINSAIGQFFSPAEASTIPLLVGKERLLPANSLFNLTLTGSQIAGLVILAPLAVKLVGFEGSFALMAIFYLIATTLVALLPQDAVPDRPGADGMSALRRAWSELTEGWRFVGAHRRVYQALIHQALVATLLLVMAMMAPGFAARVLGMSTEDAIYIFAPAGVSMLLGSYIIGRWGDRFRRDWLVDGGLLAMSVTLAALALVGRGQTIFNRPILQAFPEITLSLISAVMTCAFFLGLEVAFVSIPSQTTLQAESPPKVRGRVFAVLFTVSNLVAIPPMLFIGVLADRYGIPRVTLLVAALVLAIALWSITHTRGTERQSSQQEEAEAGFRVFSSDSSASSAPSDPLPGQDP